jgi:hypothetical protein
MSEETADGLIGTMFSLKITMHKDFMQTHDFIILPQLCSFHWFYLR